MSGQAHGFDNTVVAATESEFAKAPTSGYNWLGIVEEFSPEENNNTDQRRSVGVRGAFMLRPGQKEVDGSLSLALQNARILAYALGVVSTEGDGETTPYTHTIRPAKAGEELPSVTIQNNNEKLKFVRNYVGGKIDTLTLTASAEEAVTVEADMLFSHVEDKDITPVPVTAELQNYFMFYEGAIKINGAEVANVTEFELEIANNLERRFVLNGSNKPARITEGHLELTSSLTLDFTDLNAWQDFQDGATLVVELMLQDIADPDHSVKFTLSGGVYDTNAIAASAEDLQEQELEAIFTDIEVVAVDGNSKLI
ncbi:hypothetical protein CHCC5027_3560 [Bacillus paralicheniformis]|uniref:phage tail tube protein n=1 Tax=Bacillus paralicheniformis TaxID=1648923 RepID=UPI00119D3AB0|nr:phage tail tube protein [Bacillus paralicheniformis]TWJ39647.1 hypothetical protein CHCC5027_3560 [Bacillus paralicheniformis]